MLCFLGWLHHRVMGEKNAQQNARGSSWEGAGTRLGHCPHLPQPSLGWHRRILSQPGSSPATLKPRCLQFPVMLQKRIQLREQQKHQENPFGNDTPMFPLQLYYNIDMSPGHSDCCFCIISQKVGLDMCRSIFVVFNLEAQAQCLSLSYIFYSV